MTTFLDGIFFPAEFAASPPLAPHRVPRSQHITPTMFRFLLIVLCVALSSAFVSPLAVVSKMDSSRVLMNAAGVE